jgi:hypothetical protein
MVKKFSDEEFDAFLQKEFLHEADMVESALFSDEDFEKIELSDEEVEASYQRLVEKLKRDGVYREEADTEMLRIEDTGKKSKKRYSHSLVRAAGFVVICVLGVFAASMTSEANRKYFIESLRYVAGDDTRLVIDNDNTNEGVVGDEYAAIEKIGQELGVEMPEFHFRPTHFEYYNYEVVKEAGIGRMEYQYKDMIISVIVDKNSEIRASANVELKGEKNDTIAVVLNDKEIEVNIIETQDEQDTAKTYTAQWEFQDVFYQIDGKIERSELEKMIQYMKY